MAVKKKTGVTVVMPGVCRNFPNCGHLKPEQDLTGRITRTRLSDKPDGNVLGFAPASALIIVHWKTSTSI